MTVPVSIPRHRDDVTAGWLSDVLGVPVEQVEVVAVGTGQTGATYRVSAEYSYGPGELPATFIIKLPTTDDTVRDRVALGYRSECAFYASVAHRVQVPIPSCYHCAISDDAADYALLLADQAPAAQGDQILGCDERAARLAATAIAGLHGPTWNQTEWQQFPGLVMSLVDDAAKTGMGEIAVMSAQMTVDKLAERLDPADRATFTDVMGLVTPWLADLGRFSLIHGDYRLDNLLFHPDGAQVWVVDWQTLGVGLPARDLAYFAATSLEPGLRARLDRTLVADYHAALRRHGVHDYDLETCWYDYRYGMLQAPLICALGLAFAVGTDRGDDMMVTMLRRGCQAVRELDTARLIRDRMAG